MHEELHVDFLHVRREQHTETQVFICVKGLAPRYLRNMFRFRQHDHSMITRAERSMTLEVPNLKLSVSRKGFRYRGPIGWNKLDQQAKTSETLLEFKHAIR